MNLPVSHCQETLGDPDWLAHRYDAPQDAVQFVAAPRALRRSAPFLTDEYLKPGQDMRAFRRTDALAIGAHGGPLHFLFHSAYCCSTLLASALDIPGIASTLKEPQILNDVVGWRQRGATPGQVGAVLNSALHLLCRPFEAGEATIIKPSNVVNGLAEAMMGMRPDARCIILYAPLRVFLASIARKGMGGRLWVRELLSRQLVDGLVDLGFETRDHLLHTDLQAGAVGWLAQHSLFDRIARRWPDRVRTLNSETLVARPAEALRASAELFGLLPDDETVARVVTDIFSRDAKTGDAFASGQREADRLSGEALHADEIDKVALWAEAVARNANVSLDLPLPLVSA